MFPQERIVHGREVQSLVLIHGGFSFFDCNGLLDSVKTLMVPFLSDRTLALWGLMLTPVAQQCSKTAKIARDWCSLIWVQKDFGRIFYKNFGLYI